MKRRERLGLGLLFLAEASGLVLVALGLAFYSGRPSLVAVGVAVMALVLTAPLLKGIRRVQPKS